MQRIDNDNQNYNKNEEQEHRGKKRHGLLMILCCLVPILIIIGLTLYGVKAKSLTYIAFLICPLMHIGMMIVISKLWKGRSCHGGTNNETK